MPPPIPEATKDVIRQLLGLGGARPDVAVLTGVSLGMVDKVASGRPRRLHPHAGKLNAEKVRQIRARSPEESNSALARAFGVSEAMIRKVVDRRCWASVD